MRRRTPAPLPAARPVRVALAVAVATALLTGCGVVVPAPSTSPSGSAESTSGEPSALPAPTPDAEDGGEPGPDDCGMSSEDYAIVEDALRTANSTVLRSYVGSPVTVTYAATEYGGTTTDPALVVANLGDVMYAGVSWEFDIPAGDLAIWAASPHYGADFTDCALVGVQSDGRGVSLTFSGGRIVRQNVAFDVASWGF